MQYIKYFKYLYENDTAHQQALNSTGFWGSKGAGCIFIAKDTGRILLGLRGDAIEQPGTWGNWGGAIDKNESPATAVLREIKEETGYNGSLKLFPMVTFKKDNFEYFNYVAVIEKEFIPTLSWETKDYKWVNFGEFPKPIHFGVSYLLTHSSNDIKHIIHTLQAITL